MPDNKFNAFICIYGSGHAVNFWFFTYNNNPPRREEKTVVPIMMMFFGPYGFGEKMAIDQNIISSHTIYKSGDQGRSQERGASININTTSTLLLLTILVLFSLSAWYFLCYYLPSYYIYKKYTLCACATITILYICDCCCQY